ncbi:MAG TPA: right-handed parallel beta-helix repeat-containing protein [Prolixibacteraceae bacterium]|nr:right-handed parallel beta-helix repeat-containing protein [Prolixibacteraceae bacterium]
MKYQIIIVFLFLSIHCGANTQSSLKSRIWYVKQNDFKSTDFGSGTNKQPFKTISKAASQALPGDTVLIFNGIYREHVAPENGGLPGKPIVYIVASNQRVLVKGSELWKAKLSPVDSLVNTYSGYLDPKLFDDFNPFKIQAKGFFGNKHLGQVFVDGTYYQEVENQNELKAISGSWMVSNKGSKLIIHFDPSNISLSKRMIEITVRNRIFAPNKRGLGYITINGFIFEHCANQGAGGFWEESGTQAGAISCRSGHHWIIENNTIRYAKNIGLDCGSEGGIESKIPVISNQKPGYHLIRNNIVSDNGECGIAGYIHTGTKIIGNLIERNNNLGSTGIEEAGIKCHFLYDGLIEGNILRDNDCAGIWLDNTWYNTRITRNLVLNSTGQGIFIEMGSGKCLIDNNIVGFTKLGDGIYTHDASGVTIAHNLLFANSHYGIYMRTVSERTAHSENGLEESVKTSNQRILNNIFVDNYRGNICLPLNSERGKNNFSDYNLFLGGYEWQWEGLNLLSFTIGTNDHRISSDSLAQNLKNAFIKNNYPSEKQPNIELWKNQPLLTFEWWQILTGNDSHSLALELGDKNTNGLHLDKGSIWFSQLNNFFFIKNSEIFNSMKCPALQGIDKDFSNVALSKDLVNPGPFQKYSEGENIKYVKPLNN